MCRVEGDFGSAALWPPRFGGELLNTLDHRLELFQLGTVRAVRQGADDQRADHHHGSIGDLHRLHWEGLPGDFWWRSPRATARRIGITVAANNPSPRVPLAALRRRRRILPSRRASTYNRGMDQAASPANIYLDHNATSPMAPQVVEAMAEAMQAGYANPASQHQAGRQARRVVEAARERMVDLLGGQTTGRGPDRLLFTSGGTEANNLALFGFAGKTPSEGGQVILSPIEHPSVAVAAEELARRGWQVDRLAVSEDGVVDTDSLHGLMSPRTRLVSVMLGNNETGAIQPVAELAAIANIQGIPLHTDAVQAVGKIDVHFGRLAVVALSFTAHKLHGPLGIGGLLVRGDVEPLPQLFGGFQQAALRPGTESVPLVVGMRTALELWNTERRERQMRLASLRDRLERQVCTGFPAARVVASAAERLPHTANLAFVGLDRQALFVALDLAGVACSTGSACASGSSEPSSVLVAMDADQAIIRGSLRFSVGAETTVAEVDEATRRILLTCNKLERRKGG